MARRLSYSARYPFDPKTVHETLKIRQFWDDAMEEFRKFTPTSEVHTFDIHNDGSFDVVLKQVIPRSELPPIAQSVMKVDMVVTRSDHFGAFNAERTSGTYQMSIPAGPGSLTGVQELFPTESGSTVRKTTEVKVYIPFVGSKLEQLMLVNLVDLWRGEAEFISAWIRKNL